MGTSGPWDLSAAGLRARAKLASTNPAGSLALAAPADPASPGLELQPPDHGVPGSDLPRGAGPHLRPEHLLVPQWQRLVPKLGGTRQQQQCGLRGRAAGTSAHFPRHPRHHHGGLLRGVRRGLGGQLPGHVRDHPVSAGSGRYSGGSQECGSGLATKTCGEAPARWWGLCSAWAGWPLRSERFPGRAFGGGLRGSLRANPGGQRLLRM